MRVPTPRHSDAHRQLAGVLLDLAGLLRKLATEAADVAVIGAASAVLERNLAERLTAQGPLRVEAGPVQLVVDGMETDPDFEPLRDLAIHLREVGVGALEFRPGVTADELVAVLGCIADPAVAGLPGTPHISVHRVVRVAGEQDADPWLWLERVLCGPLLMEPRTLPELVFALEMLRWSPETRGRVLQALIRVARERPEAEARRRLIELIEAIPTGALKQLLAAGDNPGLQGEFLREIAPILAPLTALRLLQAVSVSRRAPYSVAALRALAAVARRAEATQPGTSARVLTGELVRLSPVEEGPPASDSGLEPERVLKLALESGAVEPGSLASADRMIARRQVLPLLALLDTVPREDPVGQAIRGRLFHPQAVRSLLRATPVDLDALDRLIPSAGIEAAPALLHALAESRERRVRLRLVDLLSRYGTALGPLVVERLEGMPWYVQRNLLLLLGRLPEPPLDFSPGRFLHHHDARVRHAALALAISDPAERDEALGLAVESDYPLTLRLALVTLAERCPPELVPRLIARATDPVLDPDLRALAVTALAPIPDPVVLRVLRRLALAGGIAPMGRLATKSPPMVAALRGLAQHWHEDPKVARILQVARESHDGEIRQAVRLPVRRSTGASRVRA